MSVFCSGIGFLLFIPICEVLGNDINLLNEDEKFKGIVYITFYYLFMIGLIVGGAILGFNILDIIR